MDSGTVEPEQQVVVVAAEDEHEGEEHSEKLLKKKKRLQSTRDLREAITAQPVKGKTANQILEELKKNPDTFLDPEEVEHLVEAEFPDEEKWPSKADVIDSCLHCGENGLQFKLGQWIERPGSDMLWHLEQIRRISRTVDLEEPDKYQYWYKTSCGSMFRVEDVRAPRDGLQLIFGARPFLWLEWALLKTEQFIRFQEDHERDFEIVDFITSADRLFEEWLTDERNKDFKELYDQQPDHLRKKLKDHIFSPFKLMSAVLNDKERWNFEEVEPSIYQYNGLLGSGFVTSIIVLFIQVMIPFLLFMYQIRSSSRFPNYGYNNVSSLDFKAIFETNAVTFCNQAVAFDAVIINFIVFLVYVIRVVPEVWDSFYETVGDKDNLNSRVNSLREISWQQGDDTIWMQLGFKLNRYLNAFYVALLNLILLFILFLTTTTIDVILNALALDFVSGFDEDIAKTDWYDPDRRFYRAAILETILRGELHLEPMEFPKTLCKMFEIDLDVYEEKIGHSIYDPKQANIDTSNPMFMSPKDKLWLASAQAAELLKRKDAIIQFEESTTYFGIVDSILKPKHGIFHRYDEYCTWSRWDILLFLPKLPDPEVLRINAVRKTVYPGVVNISALSSRHHPIVKLTNFDPESNRGSGYLFIRQVVFVLLFGNLVQNIYTVYRRKKYYQIPFRFFDGVFEWFTFIFIAFIFPVCLLGYFYLIFACQPVY